MNNSPSNIFCIMLLLERYQQNCQAVLAATSTNRLFKDNIPVSLLVLTVNYTTHKHLN